MKPFSPAPRGKSINRETAWGCCTANFALPGSGSVAGGRRVGYAQGTLAIIGLVMSLLFGMHFIVWGVKNLTRFSDPDTDPIAAFRDMWLAVRWPLLGLGLFAVAWLWALVTSLSLLQQAKREATADAKPVPPRLET